MTLVSIMEKRPRTALASGDIRLDVKTASGRTRTHVFTHDQCDPPPGTIAIVASLFVERTGAGCSLQDLIRAIETLAAHNSDLVMKLHDIVAGTLGNALHEALTVRFDERLTRSSVHFYDLRSIPAIRGELPAGVRDVHFCSDLSGAPELLPEELVQREPGLSDFLPMSLTRA